MTNAQPTFGAIGPSQIDPRSGEILDADIGFESLIVAQRAPLALAGAGVAGGGRLAGADAVERARAGGRDDGAGRGGRRPRLPTSASTPTWPPSSWAMRWTCSRRAASSTRRAPRPQQFVLDYLTDTTMHEVGHTLGLRHNFRASRVYTDAQLSDPEFTRKNGLTGSVMEYAPINLPPRASAAASAFQSALGPYDYWAIEYAYKPIAPEHENAELQRIAARSNEPQLAYGTDEDNFLGIDPESLHFDLGNDPVAFAKKRFEIARDLIRAPGDGASSSPNEDYSVLRRSLNFALRDVARAVGHPGAPDRRRAHVARLPRQRPRPAAAGERADAAPGARCAGQRRAGGRQLRAVAGAAAPPGARLRRAPRRAVRR